MIATVYYFFFEFCTKAKAVFAYFKQLGWIVLLQAMCE